MNHIKIIIIRAITLIFAPLLIGSFPVQASGLNGELTSAPDLNGTNVAIVKVASTSIRGPEAAYQPRLGPLIDLDNGFAIGTTVFDRGGFVWMETYAPWLWSEKRGISGLFKLDEHFDYERSIYIANGASSDGSKVVGSVIFFELNTTAPWYWAADGRAVELLELPEGNFSGGALAVSDDGRLVAGLLTNNLSSACQAVVWREGVLERLSTQPWSEVGDRLAEYQHPMNSAGTVIIGASGPTANDRQAKKWVHGIEQQLPMSDFVAYTAKSSVATFVADNDVIFGTATLYDGRVVLARWDSEGNAALLEPPNGLSIVGLSSIDTLGNAAGGALAQSTSCVASNDPACAQYPFVWTLNNGFAILPKLGLDDYYHFSTVTDVSDDGQVAVGQLTPAVRWDGSPRAVGFVWTKELGLVLVNDLLKPFQNDPDYWAASRVSRDGKRIFVEGNRPRRDEADTSSLILDLTWAETIVPRVTPHPLPFQTPELDPSSKTCRNCSKSTITLPPCERCLPVPTPAEDRPSTSTTPDAPATVVTPLGTPISEPKEGTCKNCSHASPTPCERCSLPTPHGHGDIDPGYGDPEGRKSRSALPQPGATITASDNSNAPDAGPTPLGTPISEPPRPKACQDCAKTTKVKDGARPRLSSDSLDVDSSIPVDPPVIGPSLSGCRSCPKVIATPTPCEMCVPPGRNDGSK